MADIQKPRSAITQLRSPLISTLRLFRSRWATVGLKSSGETDSATLIWSIQHVVEFEVQENMNMVNITLQVYGRIHFYLYALNTGLTRWVLSETKAVMSPPVCHWMESIFL